MLSKNCILGKNSVGYCLLSFIVRVNLLVFYVFSFNVFVRYISIMVMLLLQNWDNILTSSVFFKSLGKIDSMYFLNVVKFTSNSIWAWNFLCKVFFSYEFKFCNRCRTTKIFYFFSQFCFSKNLFISSKLSNFINLNL